MLELFSSTGNWAVVYLAKPILIWTFFALLLQVWFVCNKRSHAVTLYGLQVALVIALPLSIISAALLSIPMGNVQVAVVYDNIVANYAQPLTISPEETTNFTFSVYHLTGLLFFISLFSIIAYMIRTGISYTILLRWKYYANPVTEKSLLNVFEEQLQLFTIRRKPQVAYSTEVSGPVTYGWFRPVILLPVKIKKPDEFRTALQHELIHIQRSDFAIHVFVSAVRSLFVWHPLIHLLARAVAKNREISCDSKVLANANLPAKTYAGLLLTYAVATARRRSFSVAMADPPIKLEERIKAMQNQYNQPEKYARAAKSALVFTPMLIGLIFLVSACDFGSSGLHLYNEAELDHAPEMKESPFLYLSDKNIIPDDEIDFSNLIAEVTITRNGKATNVTLLNTIGSSYENHLKNALTEITWNPGYKDDQPVNSRIQVPFESTRPYITVEDPPQPIGGIMEIHKNLRYPETARSSGIEGVVVVGFIVDRNGESRDFNILRGIGGGADEAAIDAIKAVDWEPGQQNGRNVDVRFQVPIRFQLATE